VLDLFCTVYLDGCLGKLEAGLPLQILLNTSNLPSATMWQRRQSHSMLLSTLWLRSPSLWCRSAFFAPQHAHSCGCVNQCSAL
jgi:hypothetical protein